MIGVFLVWAGKKSEICFSLNLKVAAKLGGSRLSPVPAKVGCCSVAYGRAREEGEICDCYVAWKVVLEKGFLQDLRPWDPLASNPRGRKRVEE